MLSVVPSGQASDNHCRHGGADANGKHADQGDKMWHVALSDAAPYDTAVVVKPYHTPVANAAMVAISGRPPNETTDTITAVSRGAFRALQVA